MFSHLYWDMKTGPEHPVVGNNSVTARRGWIVQLKDTSFWSLPDNTVYTGHLTESSSSKLTALSTTGSRRQAEKRPCSMEVHALFNAAKRQMAARFNKAVYLNASGKEAF